MHTWRLISIGSAGCLVSLLLPSPARADVPYAPYCYYVPQAGPVQAPVEGQAAIRYFRMCPNNEGGTSLPNSARIKVVVKNAAGLPIDHVDGSDVVALLNGGTPEQGFSGVGADSIVSNSQYNPICPDVRAISADGPTDPDGATYITFTGTSPGARGMGVPDPSRKWGHYDSKIPIYVVGFELSGRLTSESANGTYTLQIKCYDHTGGLGTGMGQGEAVTSADFNGVANNIGVVNALTWWRDFDSTGGIAATDFNLVAAHVTHDCDTPNQP
ncbi:MAG TPA: hypothetical protein VFP58_12865 [Candidatus Eisenbacteria bacterium]|nr:hypothetical protein [Candidatus Eisenbacteria bacterium]